MLVSCIFAITVHTYVTVFRETNWLSWKLLCYLLHRAKMPPSKFEANPMLRLRVKRTSFSIFPLVSSCSKDFPCVRDNLFSR